MKKCCLGFFSLGIGMHSNDLQVYRPFTLQMSLFLTLSLSLSLTFASPLSSHTHLPSPSSHRRSSQSRPPLVLDPHISGPLWCRKQEDLPCAGGSHDTRVEALIGGAGDDHYLVVLTEFNAPRGQHCLKVGQQILRRLSCYYSL